MEPELFQIAKILPPEAFNQIPRPELLNLLEKNSNYPLIMLVNHAGTGKTMLAADFIRRLSAPVAWYSLDESDQNIYQFGFYLLEAVRRVVPGFGEPEGGFTYSTTFNSISASLGRSKVTPELIHRLAGAFLHDLALLHSELSSASPQTGRTQFWLVLDDYQFAESPDVNLFLQQLTRWLPPGSHIFLVSRELSGELPFIELVARQRAFLLGGQHLRFKLTEVEALLENRYGQTPKALARRLLNFTGGWAVMLILTLLSLDQAVENELASLTRNEGLGPGGEREEKEGGETEAGGLYPQTGFDQHRLREEILADWLDQVTGNRFPVDTELKNFRDEPLFAYLADLLFHQHSSQRQGFLLETSLLDSLAEADCDYITEGRYGPARTHLLDLERQGLFISRKASEPGLFYQYHILIKTFLQAELAAHPLSAQKAYYRVAQLYEERGQTRKAVEYWLKAKEEVAAVLAIDRVSLRLYETGQMKVLEELLGQVPVSLKEKHPNLWHVKGLLAQEAGQLEVARESFLRAIELYKEQGAFALVAKVEATYAYLLTYFENNEEARRVALAVLDYQSGKGDEESHWTEVGRGIARLVLGEIAQKRGQFEEAESHLAQAQSIFRKEGDLFRLNITLGQQANLYKAWGYLIKARTLYSRVILYWQRTGNLGREAHSYHMLALTRKQTGQFEEAIRDFQRNLQRQEELDLAYLEPYTYHELGDCYQALGEYRRAGECYQKSLEMARGKLLLEEC